VICGPGHIQCNYCSPYSGFNIQLNISVLLFEISRQFKALHTAKLVPNIAHILQLTLSELWSRTYAMKLLFRIFRLHYSSESTWAAIGDIASFGWALYCKFGAIYSAHHPVYAIWTVVTDIYNVVTVTYIHASIFKWTCLRCYWRYSDISMRVMLQIWCQIQPTSSSLRYVNCGHEIYNAITVPHIHASIFKWKYLLWYWRYFDNSICVILQTWCQIQRTSYS
jgi:hypothetical protein